MLECIGICDGSLALDAYANSLLIELAGAFSINAAIREHRIMNINPQKETLMKGIDFECDYE